MIKTKPDEFVKFHKLLMSNAPVGYIPWYFPVEKHNKAPDGLEVWKRAPKEIKNNRGNWKAPWAKLTFSEALERLKQDKNVGISARKNDELIIIDIDEWNYTNLAPNTLTILSRKRCGIHAFCWKHPQCETLPLNIPTDYGEVRSSDQYVVAAGSYCETSENDIKCQDIELSHKNKIYSDPNIGVYTIYKEKSPCFIKYEELPIFFLKRKVEVDKKIKEEASFKTKTIQYDGKKSALYDLKINDLISYSNNIRKPHPLHSSDTGKNFCVSDGLGHCWRHDVSLNAIQFLVVKSGYMSCLDAGTGHKNSGAGGSMVVNDDGAIFHAWLEAKRMGVIPIDDPVPVRAMHYIAKKYKLVESNYSLWKLPLEVYNKVLKIIEDDY